MSDFNVNLDELVILGKTYSCIDKYRYLARYEL